MRAVVHDRYGEPEVLRLADVDQPAPKDDEVLVKVHATTVNRTDCGFRDPSPFFIRLFSGVTRPRHRILGSEFAGVVEAVGPAVTEFAVGDEVFGVSSNHFGTHAEYVCLREDAPLAAKPAGMSFEEAAAVGDGAILALNLMRPARPGPGRRIVVYGASGAIGTAAVQLAKHAGAHVTAVCDTVNLETVRSLGPDEVVDYTQDDFAENADAYDAVFDAVGKLSFGRCRRSLRRGGRYISSDLGFLWQNTYLPLVTWPLSRKVKFPIPRYKQEQVLFLKELIEAGEYRTVIDRTYPLEDVVEATRYVETGQKTGNVVLTL